MGGGRREAGWEAGGGRGCGVGVRGIAATGARSAQKPYVNTLSFDSLLTSWFQVYVLVASSLQTAILREQGSSEVNLGQAWRR